MGGGDGPWGPRQLPLTELLSCSHLSFSPLSDSPKKLPSSFGTHFFCFRLSLSPSVTAISKLFFVSRGHRKRRRRRKKRRRVDVVVLSCFSPSFPSSAPFLVLFFTWALGVFHCLTFYFDEVYRTPSDGEKPFLCDRCEWLGTASRFYKFLACLLLRARIHVAVVAYE